MHTPLYATLLGLVLAGSLSAQHVLRSTYGNYTPGGFGTTIAVGRDHGADGVLDYLVGAPERRFGISAASGSVAIVSGLDGSARVEAVQPRAGRRLGTAITALGDVDNDGLPDFASSTPYDNAGGTNAGWVGCFSGRHGGLIWQIIGSYPDSYFGQSILTVPDLDGDGLEDLAVGAPRNTGSLPTGRVYFFSGRTGAQIRILTSGVGGDSFGQSLAMVGDQNGDGRPDLAVGAPYGVGMIRVFSLASATLPPIWSSVQAYGFGHVVASAGDVDGDGRTDVLVERQQTASLPGSVYVLSGATTQIIRTHFGQSGESFGAAVAGGADVDADGRPDYVIGAPGAAGGAGRFEVRSGRTGAVLFGLTGTSNERRGTAVAMVSDLDGDNLAEVLVGSPGYDYGAAIDGGRVEVIGYDLPGTATIVGQGCNGLTASAGLIPDTTALRYGGTARVTAPALGAAAPGLWLIGLSPQSAPTDMTPFGMAGCTLWVHTDVLVPFQANALGAAVLNVSIPNSVAFTGQHLFVQAACTDPGSNALGVILTQAWQLQVGLR